MIEARVDHSVRSGRAVAQTLEVIERTALHIGSCRSKGRGSRIRTSQPEHLMARADEFRNDCGANKACSSRDKDSHILFSL